MDFSQDFVILCGASVRAAAEAARCHTKNIVGIDFFGDSDLRDICTHWTLLDRTDPARSIREALKVCELMKRAQGWPQHPTTMPIPIIFTGGYESWGGELENNVPETGLLLAPPWNVVKELRSSPFLKSVAEKSGVRYPETIACDSNEDLKRFARQQAVRPSKTVEAIDSSNKDRWLMKSTHGAGGLGVWFAELGRTDEEFETSDDGQCLLQQYIPGVPIGASFISNGRDVGFLGAARSIVVPIGDRPFVYGGSMGMLELGEPLGLRMLEVAKQIVSATGIRGLFGIDFQLRRSDRSLWLLEVNPRYTASMELLERVSGLSLVNAHQMAFADDKFDVCVFASGVSAFGCELLTEYGSHNDRFIKKVVWATSDVVWTLNEDASSAANRLYGPPGGSDEVPTPGDGLRFTFADMPAEGAHISAGQPVATLICSGPSWISIRRCVDQVERRLLNRIAVKG